MVTQMRLRNITSRPDGHAAEDGTGNLLGARTVVTAVMANAAIEQHMRSVQARPVPKHKRIAAD